MKNDAVFQKFISSWYGAKGPRPPKHKLFVVDKSNRRKRIDANGFFVEFEDGSGMFISAAKRGKGDTACLMSWPDGPERCARFVTKACCSNVIDVGVEVYKTRKGQPTRR